MKPTIEDLVAAYAAGKSIRYSTTTGFSELTSEKRGYPHGTPRYGFRHCSHKTEGKSLAFLTRSPEESIRAALTTVKQDGTTRTLEIWDKIWDKIAETTAKPVSPPPAPLVPLGPNKTRDGREARVICIDRVHDKFKPVLALVVTGKGREEQRTFHANGQLAQNSKSPIDLVGHLPPEPAKPREFWINGYEYRNGVLYHDKRTADLAAGSDRRECVHVREVLPGQDDELERLRGWKTKALKFIACHVSDDEILKALGR